MKHYCVWPIMLLLKRIPTTRAWLAQSSMACRGQHRQMNNVPISGSSNGWDDFGPFDDQISQPQRERPRSPSIAPSHRRRNNGRNDGNDRRKPDRREFDRSFIKRPSQRFARAKEASELKINMNALEGAGFVHLYGLAPVLNALIANRRDFTNPESRIDLNLLDDTTREHEQRQRGRKPEAQFQPYLFVQATTTTTTMQSSGRSRDKSLQAARLLELAEQRGVPVAEVDKGVLNALSGNRPHQGYVLRCGALNWDENTISRLDVVSTDNDDQQPALFLILDEVVDPQNVGALIRTATFLGRVQIVVCAKNSAPASPVVSAASAGALETATVRSTSNLPRLLAQAEQDGFRIIGAASSAPKDGDDIVVYDLPDLPSLAAMAQPTVLVLGSEGSGLRPLVARSCTELVRIPSVNGDDNNNNGVDSLNVSVAGGILLWHMFQNGNDGVET